MEHGAAVGHGGVLHDVHLAGLDVQLHLGEAHDPGLDSTLAGVVVLGRSHQTLAGQPRGGGLRHVVEIVGDLLAAVPSTQLHGAGCGPREAHSRGRARATEDPTVGGIVVSG